MNIQSTFEGGVQTLTIHRPERKNAFTAQMYTDLAREMIAAQENEAVRAICIQGVPGVFSAGNDIGEFLKEQDPLEDAPVFKFLRVISKCPKPIVAKVQGVAVGIGTTMLLHCDLVYASASARFSMPFTQLGVCAEGASSLLVPMMAGYHKAAELLLLGEMFDANTAKEVGIVNAVVADDAIDAHVKTVLDKLVYLPPASIRSTKRLLKARMADAIAGAINEEGQLFLDMVVKPEAKEALTAFTEKRKPDFSKFS